MEQVVRLISRAWLPRRSPQQPGQVHQWPLVHWLPRGRLLAGGIAVVWVLSLFLAAWIVSGWFWDRAAPAVASLPTAPLTDPVVAAQAIAAKHLMGEAKAQSGGADAPRPKSYRLLGLMTASDKLPGFAILLANGKESLVVVEGDEIVPGLTLLKVLPDKVVIGREGSTETIALD